MIFAIVAILGLSAVCGKMIVLVYEKRDKFYEELETFCMFMKNEIGFCQTKTGMIFDKFVKTYKIKNFEAFKELKSCVDFPHPDGPIINTFSPFSISKSIFFKTT